MHEVQTEKPNDGVMDGRIDNSINVDTSDCLTFEQMVRLAGAPTNTMAGCETLDYRTKVIGSLEVKSGTDR